MIISLIILGNFGQLNSNRFFIQQWRDNALLETIIIKEDEAGEILSLIGALAH